MPSIGRQFGSGNGVPRSAEALAALGVEVKGDKGLEREREGAKGLGEIVLSAAEQLEAEKSEDVYRYWTKEDFYKWADGFDDSDSYDYKGWIDKEMYFRPDDGVVVFQRVLLDFSNRDDFREIPPNLSLEMLRVGGTGIREIPPGILIPTLDLSHTQVADLPKNTGRLSKIMIDPSQTVLKRIAEQRGIKVVVKE